MEREKKKKKKNKKEKLVALAYVCWTNRIKIKNRN